MEYIKLGNAPLSYNDCYEILINNKFIELDDDAMAEVYKSHSFLKEFIKDKVIYGVNTGFGPMAQYKINQEDQVQLQYNLIRSHCSGSGNQVAILNIRALMLARLNTLLLGYSGINPDALILLKEMINREIYPVIYEHGGLGASGDLVQLAHVALALIGEGEVHYKGYIAETTVAFGSEDLKPLAIYIREGLALMNGTSAMCGIGLVNLIHSKNLLKLSIAATSMIVELVESYDDHYSAELNSVKRHPGQNYVANEMKLFLSGSRLIRKREQYLYDKSVSENIINDKVQENYSIRCVPQILGPVADTINYA